MNLSHFYDSFHKKNNFYQKIIDGRNFTYFYILQFLQEPCIKTVARPRILDVGCGVGALALYLAKQGGRVIGIDISPQAIKIANYARQANHLRSVIFKSGELRAGSGDFDQVICTEVIEHIQDDAKFLQLIKSQLKTGGILLLTTPSQENWLYRWGFYRQFDQRVGHLRRYTVKSLTQLLARHGFKIIKVKPVEGPPRNILFTTRLGGLIKFMKGPLVPIFHWLDQLAAQIWGASDIMILASKV